MYTPTTITTIGMAELTQGLLFLLWVLPKPV
jgi:hypothetical protein